ncbi:MAG TPA: molecular chaperone TorD family protein [bacterium]
MGPVATGRTIPGWCPTFGDLRSDAYVLLAALLGPPPTEGLLHIVRNLAWDGPLPGTLERSLAGLRRAGAEHPLPVVEDEHRVLFVGLGSGEVVPYASWYRERTLQSLPLAALRSDLLRLGLVRQAGCPEPEDHAGALCEIMALLSGPSSEVPLAHQAQVFGDHLAPWMGAFFGDLHGARGASFYRAVGDFGARFLEAESRYFAFAPEWEPFTEGA